MIRLILLTIALTVAVAGAATIDVPADQVSLNAAVAAAASGDTIRVWPGTYSGPENRNIVIDALDLVVITTDGAAATVIDAEDLGLGFDVRNGSDVLIRGFTIRNAAGGNGSAVVLYQSTGTISACLFENNSVSMNAGAVWIGYTTTSVTVEDCGFQGNSSVFRAGALMIDHADAVIARCLFTDNAAGTLGGGAMHFNVSTTTTDACVLVGNDGGGGAGGIEASSTISATITNTIIADSSTGAATNGGIYSHCIAWNNPGGDDLGDALNNLATDPLFCDPVGGDYQVCADSPAVAGTPSNPWGEDVGHLGSGCADVPNKDLSWSDVKTLFR